jgi:hypothetical protein
MQVYVQPKYSGQLENLCENNKLRENYHSYSQLEKSMLLKFLKCCIYVRDIGMFMQQMLRGILEDAYAFLQSSWLAPSPLPMSSAHLTYLSPSLSTLLLAGTTSCLYAR